MAAIEAAKYIVFADEKLNKTLLQNQIEQYLLQKEILVMKKTKRNVNINYNKEG